MSFKSLIHYLWVLLEGCSHTPHISTRKLPTFVLYLLTWLLNTCSKYMEDQNLNSFLEPKSGKLYKSLMIATEGWKPKVQRGSREQALSLKNGVLIVTIWKMLFPLKCFVLHFYLQNNYSSYFPLLFYFANIISCQWESFIVTLRKMLLLNIF
jgi:hypothetical protein